VKYRRIRPTPDKQFELLQHARILTAGGGGFSFHKIDQFVAFSKHVNS
jgi:hypothetical protein